MKLVQETAPSAILWLRLCVWSVVLNTFHSSEWFCNSSLSMNGMNCIFCYRVLFLSFFEHTVQFHSQLSKKFTFMNVIEKILFVFFFSLKTLWCSLHYLIFIWMYNIFCNYCEFVIEKNNKEYFMWYCNSIRVAMDEQHCLLSSLDCLVAACLLSLLDCSCCLLLLDCCLLSLLIAARIVYSCSSLLHVSCCCYVVACCWSTSGSNESTGAEKNNIYMYAI